jgi:hypothetical protein
MTLERSLEWQELVLATSMNETDPTTLEEIKAQTLKLKRYISNYTIVILQKVR